MHVHVPLVAFRTRSKQLTKRIVGNLLEGDFDIPSLKQADLGTCPLCDTRIVQTPKVYTCENGRDCDWFLSREISGKAITPDILQAMLVGEAPLIEGLTSQNGNKYDARLTFDDNAELEFIFDD